MDTENLGKRVQQRRTELGLTVRQLSERLGISDTAIRKIEKGNGTRYGAELAQALGVSATWLTTGDPNQAPMPVPPCGADADVIERREMGQRAQRRRKELKLTQRDLAARLGVSNPTIVKIEQGGRTRHLVELAKALEVPLAWLKTGDPSTTRSEVPQSGGYWPFHSARLADYESLPPHTRRELDTRLADIIAGAMLANR
ncbi:transcriptional regulator [Bordetella ansorpii]|uniref:Transcriptional regulator n=1 Tax=Bordetella ansorpii TaxID=288768 RepID=A0A157QN53_9BORD|nr:helix-turn-helix domain-containing protein [Bordetella ansorpii]SAI47303.1 transcriptional regulator [Bordetella ansorpii]